MFPLWVEPTWPGTKRLPNLSAVAIRELARSLGLSFVQPEAGARADGRGDLTASFGPRDVFDYIYAIVYSTAYRLRYDDFLKSDFARIPISPTSTLFRELVGMGEELVALHLLESGRV